MTTKITYNKEIHWLFYCKFLKRIVDLRCYFLFFDKTDNWISILQGTRSTQAPTRYGISVLTEAQHFALLKAF